MRSNLEKYEKDLNTLINNGTLLYNALYLEYSPEKVTKEQKEDLIKKFKDDTPRYYFVSNYQLWYSEALAIMKFLLPDRVDDFKKFYETPKNRRIIDNATYTIEDFLQNILVSDTLEIVLLKFQQQFKILESARQKFKSSLFDIKESIQEDLFDSEIESAQKLNDKGFIRAAGALAGVVLEKHLSQICEKHNIKVLKENPSINDYNQLLKENKIIETDKWRFIQFLADKRNLCVHDKKVEPKREEINELIDGVKKIIKVVS